MTAGTKLKSQTGWWGINNEDAFGFSALPAGFRFNSGSFSSVDAIFWSSTEIHSVASYNVHLDNDNEKANLGFNYKKNDGISVRCLKD